MFIFFQLLFGEENYFLSMIFLVNKYIVFGQECFFFGLVLRSLALKWSMRLLGWIDVKLGRLRDQEGEKGEGIE